MALKVSGVAFHPLGEKAPSEHLRWAAVSIYFDPIAGAYPSLEIDVLIPDDDQASFQETKDQCRESALAMLAAAASVLSSGSAAEIHEQLAKRLQPPPMDLGN